MRICFLPHPNNKVKKKPEMFLWRIFVALSFIGFTNVKAVVRPPRNHVTSIQRSSSDPQSLSSNSDSILSNTQVVQLPSSNHEENDACPICLGDIENGYPNGVKTRIDEFSQTQCDHQNCINTALQCRHSFCHGCIADFLASLGPTVRLTCPICRAPKGCSTETRPPSSGIVIQNVVANNDATGTRPPGSGIVIRNVEANEDSDLIVRIRLGVAYCSFWSLVFILIVLLVLSVFHIIPIRK